MELRDGGTEIISFQLRKATRYQTECKRCISLFWNHLLKEVDLSSLPEIVVSIEKYERKTDNIFTKVKKYNPK